MPKTDGASTNWPLQKVPALPLDAWCWRVTIESCVLLRFHCL